ncbi:MAG: hypothetical protein P8L32_07880 [Paracoccaceae bacterium]|jgi:hypothetical protein|nr:hypothetical protein [Paracoccaceae bacterium]
MDRSDPIAEKNWRSMIEAYNLRLRNEAELEADDDPFDITDISTENVQPHVFRKSKYPNRLRITSIAE